MRSTLSNTWTRRHLLLVLLISNLKRQNKNTALGYLWWLLDPILMTGVYYLVVGVIFHRGSNHEPFILFLVCGLIPWKAFSDSLSQSVSIIRNQASIIRAVSFPQIVLPLSIVLSNAVYFLIALLVPIALALYYYAEHSTLPTLAYLMLPAVVAIQLLFTTGVCLLTATIGVFFLDTANIVGHILRIWYFLSPGLYDLTAVPERFRLVFQLNPFSGLMTSYRSILIKGEFPGLPELGLPLAGGIVFFVLGCIIFCRYEGRFVHKL